MRGSKKDVDKQVQSLQQKLSSKEFKARAYSIARSYFNVGDYENCKNYVEQYLTQKDNNAAAYKLLGQALQKLGQKEKALENFKTSLDIDPTQTSTILDICELLADNDFKVEPGRAQYWCEKAEAIFPRHPTTFKLREKLLSVSNPDPEALVKLLTTELAARPKDAALHARLLKHYLQMKKINEAYEHTYNIEFSSENFMNNYSWYEVLDGLLKNTTDNSNIRCQWQYQLLLLTVRERLCVLSLTESPMGPSKSLIESNEHLNAYDKALQIVAQAGAKSGFAEFHASLLTHHKGQFAFHAATFMLKKAKKDQIGWRDANKVAGPLMLIAWQTVPLDPKVNWLRHAPANMLNAVNRWYTEGTYRCSQSGHYLLTNYQDRNQTFLDQVSQCCSDTHWQDKLYCMLFSNTNHLPKIKNSYFASNAFSAPVIRLPRKIEVEAFDDDALRHYGNSLHHFVWTLLNYKNFSHFKCTLFDMLTSTISNCGPETLNKMDIQAFLYCAALSARQQRANEVSLVSTDRPKILPAIITDLLCPLPQMKWWDCAYKFSQNVLGNELTDIRVTLSRGIEVIRCIDNHGLDPELLCILGRIFSERANITTSVEEKSLLELRAGLYYRSAIPLLEKLKSKIMIKVNEKRMFDYTHTDLGTRELNKLLDESKLYVASNYINDGEYDKAIEILSNIKSVHAYYQLAKTYQKLAQEENNVSSDTTKSKHVALIAKAKTFAFKALDTLKESETYKTNPLYLDTQDLIDELELQINKLDPDLSTIVNDLEGKYSSDENISCRSEPMRTNQHIFRNISSTPKGPSNANATTYRSCMESQLFETTRIEPKKDTSISDFMSQTRDMFEENKKLANQIMCVLNSNIQNTNDQFKLLKISVDQVKDQIDECKTECKDVVELKKQIADLKKEVSKLKKCSEQTADSSDLYNIDEDYRSNDSSSNFTASQLPFAPQLLQHFNQRPPFPIPPNPYQLYNPSLYNLYNQYTQFGQPSSVPGASPLFDAARAQMNYTGMYPTPDQMYLDVAHLIPPPVPAAPVVPTVSAIPPIPVIPTMPTLPTMSAAPFVTSTVSTKTTIFSESNNTSKSLPVNVVITSSDPLPTCAPVTPAPVMSVTIPPIHIKGSTPHNYQITMPTSNETKIAPPVFSFSIPDNKTPSSATNWKQTFQTVVHTGDLTLNKSLDDTSLDKTVVDGIIAGTTPNTSLNKSRTLSEKSNTSVDNYDPCPDFKPIVPLPAEITVTTGEEDEEPIFSARAKLFRFVDKQWKERGIGEMKLLKHKETGKVRVLMRRDQVHKICANHIITPEMEIKPVKNETKAYFWVANDFTDETIVLEKFSIRFKTADIAKDFYDAFEKARKEAKTSSSKTENKIILDNKSRDKSGSQQLITNETKSLAKESAPVTTSQGKTVVGGFTFSSTPIFKPVETDIKTSEAAKPAPEAKTNVFSGLTFKTNSNTPFSNIFTTSTSTVTPTVTDNEEQGKKEELNTSDTVEEYEPNVEFKPVIPLPALVEQRTGEEDEEVLYEHRAKLLRFDSNTKEWKERGLGNIKILINKNNNQKLRLLMRREQIMKVCCNHAITKDLTFQKMPNVDKAVTWCAKDFSEGELVPETFCLRFKTAKICDDFIEAIKSAQSKLKDDSKAAKEEQNAAKQTNNTGFGDKYKPLPGSWHCESCYTNNLENFDKCVCCSQPKPQPNNAITSNSTSSSTNSTTTVSWGDKFKPKPGSWECKSCFVRNDANLTNCSACSSPKDPATAKSLQNVPNDNKVTFSFGIPSQDLTNSSTTGQSSTDSKSTGFGDKFKPKEGSWECKQCLVRNESSMENCVACSSSKDPNAPKKTTSIFGDNAGAPKFTFGIPSNLATQDTSKTEAASIFAGTGVGSHTFSFGIPSTATVTSKPTGVIFAAPKMPSEPAPLNFSLKKSEEPTNTVTIKPALLPTPQTENTSFASKESGQFGFVFKPNTSAKSPNKSQEEDSDDEDVVKEEDCSAHFNPVIPMPDKIEVVTGEENETELFGHRARLYRFVSGEWKERGTGIVKILKHNETKKLRVVMRREQVLKICLNHALTNEVIYKPKDEKSWLFAVNDYSEGELSLEQLCLRFQNKDIAVQFKEAVDNALAGQPVSAKTPQSEPKIEHKESDNDVVFVSETQATADEKKKAKELMLPENFYTYKDKDPCKGCRGCKDDEVKPEQSTEAIKALLTAPPVTSSVLGTPPKSTFPTFQSPASVYNTPGATNNTFDTSIFRTPLGSTTSSAQSSTPASTSDSVTTDRNNKENIFTQKGFNFGEQKSIFGTPISSTSSIFGSANQSSTAPKGSLIAPPKLSTANAFGNSDPKSIFAAAASASPTFGTGSTSTTTSIFGATENKPLFGSKPSEDFSKSEVKSLFGSQSTDDSKYLFGAKSTDESKSLFGAKSTNESKSLFGAKSTNESKSLFGAQSTDESKSLFGTKSTDESKSLFGAKPADESKSLFGTKSTDESKSLFGAKPADESKSLFGTKSTDESKSLFGAKPADESKSLFGTKSTDESKSLFGAKPADESKSLFGAKSTDESKSLFGAKSNEETKSLFGNNDQKPLSLFNETSQGSLFGPNSLGNQTKPFGSFSLATNTNSFWNNTKTDQKKPEVPIFGSNSDKENQQNVKDISKPGTEEPVLKIDNGLSFADITSSEPGFAVQKKPDFQWEGAGQPLFSGGQKTKNNDDSTADQSGADEEYDPHYEPIVPLPEKIEVVTGEEDEEKIFGERCKLYRFNDKTSEWKERGVGEMKILYHPQRNTYRLLLRREQVHKAVLNMLVFTEMELLPMKNTDRAWTFVARNFAEVPSGEQELLAVRFKSVELAHSFRDRVVQCTRKLQAAAAKAIREEQEAKEKAFGFPQLRLPKHLSDSDRADSQLAAAANAATSATGAGAAPPAPSTDAGTTSTDPGAESPTTKANGEDSTDAADTADPRQELYHIDEEYDPDDYYHNYVRYCQEYEEEDESTYYSCTGQAVVRQCGEEAHSCPQAHILLLFDHDMCSPRIILSDAESGAVLADMLIYTETEFTMDGDSCSWSGLDYTSNEPVEKFVSVNFYDSQTAKAFYESCQTSKGAITYSSNDPEEE